ncbi:MAG: MFS transporter [Chloroflexota bacterium]
MKSNKNSTRGFESNPVELGEADSRINFWKLWGANIFSNLGDGLYQITLPLLAIHLTRSPARVAALSVMLSLPWLIFALFAGSIVDRFDRRRIMLWVNGGRLILLFFLTMTVIFDFASMSLLYGMALLLGMGETLMDTSLTSIVPSLVSKNRLNWANAQITAAQTVTNTFIGPPLAGYLAGIGYAVATGISTVLYAIAGITLTLMNGVIPISGKEEQQQKQQLWKHLTHGLQFLWKDDLIRKLTLFTALMNLFWAGWGALFVLYAVKPGPMGLNEFEYSLLLTAMALGGLAGSMFCEQIQQKIGLRNTLVLDLLGTILLVGIPALTTNFWAVGAATFMAGLGASVWVILVASIRQRVVPNILLGRVYSASRLISWGVGPLGASLAAIIAEIWGIRGLFALGSALSVGLLLLFLKTFSSMTLKAFEDSSIQSPKNEIN